MLGNVKAVAPELIVQLHEMFSALEVAEQISLHVPPEGGDEIGGYFKDIDVMLDSYPVSSPFDACRALWMGVPVLTLKGGRPTSCLGASVLKAAGCGDWIAETADGFVLNARNLTSSLEDLNALRQGLRTRVQASPLFDVERLAQDMTIAIRALASRKKGSG
jgi:predicted O-linked N-acetylglucosamine transferase (SPINDLY family)